MRRLRARLGGLALAASCDPREYTATARAAFLQRFEAEVDPRGILPEPERLRRAEAARKGYFVRLALRSAVARRARAKRASHGLDLDVAGAANDTAAGVSSPAEKEEALGDAPATNFPT